MRVWCYKDIHFLRMSDMNIETIELLARPLIRATISIIILNLRKQYSSPRIDPVKNQIFLWIFLCQILSPMCNRTIF